jgi:EmrB/QacA subfamily drug resistance transporter
MSAAPRPGWTLVATGLGLLMVFLDATIVNVALPDIQADFDTGESGLQWVVSAYSVTMAMFMMWGATFGDLHGRRLAYVGGIVLFCGASLACALAPGIGFLAVARGIQGVGAAIVNVASLALLGAAYRDPKAKAKAIGIWTGIASVGFAFGPLVGGILTEQIGWRSIFVINPIIGVVTLALTARFVAESSDPDDRSFDYPGQLLFIVGIGALTFALIQGPHLGWTSIAILVSFGIGLAGLASFVAVELRTASPMMDLRVFRDRVYSSALYVVFAVLFLVYGTLLVVTQYFQNVKDYSPEKAGLLTVAMGLPVIVLAPLTGRIVSAQGGRAPTLAGLACGVVGALIFIVSSGVHLGVTEIALVLIGAAGATTTAAVTSLAMAAIPPERSGMASGILSSQRGLGSTAGFAIMGSVLAGVLATTLPNKLEPYIPNQATLDTVVDEVVEDANPQAVTALIGPGEPLPEDVTTDDEILDATDDAFVAGIRVAMLVGFGVAASALVLAWFVFPRARARDPSKDPEQTV